MTLLSICVPTYNRHKELKELYHSFLDRAINEYGNQIEVVVCDNSDSEIANLNQAIIGKITRYYKNDTNIGANRNIIRCIKQATGEFIWIISDDDLIDWDGFSRLMYCLPTASSDGIDCIMLPYLNDDFNKNEVLNDQHDWGVKKDTNFLTLLNAIGSSYHPAPFCLFSSAVFRLNKRRLDWVTNEFQGNHYLHITIFLCMLKPESKLLFLDAIILKYVASYHVNRDVLSAYNDMKDVLLFIGREYGVNVAKAENQTYNEALSIIMANRAGICKHINVDIQRWSLLTKLPQHLHIKTIILAFMVVMPRILIRIPYIFYLSIHYAYANDELSIKKVISNFNELHHSISLKNKKYK